MEDGMVISQDSGDLHKGDQIVSIGGKSPEELLRMLWEVTSAQNEYGVRYTGQTLLQRGSYLDYFGLVKSDGTVDVEILRDGYTNVYQVPLKSTHVWPPSEHVEWSVDKEGNLGCLRLADLPPREEIGPVEVAIGLFFDAVKSEGVSNIVIDLRNTEGRYSVINGILLSYLATGPVYSSRYQVFRVEKKPDAQIFKGNTFVLTSNKSSGATVLLASLLHDNGIAVTVGEPTGEGPSFNWSRVSWEELPVTGWRFRLATEAGLERPGNYDSSAPSLLPDIPAYTSRLDLIEGRDAQMATVREVIASLPEVVIAPLVEIERRDDTVEDWTKGSLPSYIRSFSYVERFHYFIVVYDQPIKALNPQGVTVTTASGQELVLRSPANLNDLYTDTLTIAPRDWVTEADSCVITLPAKSVVLEDGSTNSATLKLGKYQYHSWSP
jgi:hypothetical protein